MGATDIATKSYPVLKQTYTHVGYEPKEKQVLEYLSKGSELETKSSIKGHYCCVRSHILDLF